IAVSLAVLGRLPKRVHKRLGIATLVNVRVAPLRGDVVALPGSFVTEREQSLSRRDQSFPRVARQQRHRDALLCRHLGADSRCTSLSQRPLGPLRTLLRLFKLRLGRLLKLGHLRLKRFKVLHSPIRVLSALLPLARLRLPVRLLMLRLLCRHLNLSDFVLSHSVTSAHAGIKNGPCGPVDNATPSQGGSLCQCPPYISRIFARIERVSK